VEYYIDGQRVMLDSLWARNGTLSTGTEAVHYFPKGNDRFFYFPGSGISFHIRKKHSSMLGCFLNVKLCLPDDITQQERIVGLLGTPNGNTEDDFMDSNGVDLGHKSILEWKDAYDYCTQNWCIKDKADSLFVTPIDTNYCNEPYDETLELQVKNSPQELVDLCGGDIACLIEGTAGDISDSTESIAEQRAMVSVEAIPEIDANDPGVEDQDKVFEATNVDPADHFRSAEGADPYAAGDPHFRLWNGGKFDFQ